MKTFEEVAESFKQSMIKENNDNAHKGNILDWYNIDEMLSELEWHKAKLLFALKDGDKDRIKEHLADCGNFLAAIGNASEVYNT